MAKKRILKKEISHVANELYTEALLCSIFVKNIEMAAIEQVVSRILEMEDNFIRRAHKPDAKENKARVKAYYKKLVVDLEAETEAISKELEKLSKGA
ncbi:MAG TPA: hypothetical protein DD409_12330 [Bacteroidales bacterium]|jgi:hypothetical protein|nr:hypothetical protein [Bacteroidales bacterium]